jgi:hypothetical protein
VYYNINMTSPESTPETPHQPWRPSYRAVLHGMGMIATSTLVEYSTARATTHNCTPQIVAYRDSIRDDPNVAPVVFLPGSFTQTDADYPSVRRTFNSKHQLTIGIDQVTGYSPSHTASALEEVNCMLQKTGYKEGLGCATIIASSMGIVAVRQFLEMGGQLPRNLVTQSPVAGPDSLKAKMPRIFFGGTISGEIGSLMTKIYRRKLGTRPIFDDVASSPAGQRMREENNRLCEQFPRKRPWAYTDYVREQHHIPELEPVTLSKERPVMLVAEDTARDDVLRLDAVVRDYQEFTGIDPTYVQDMNHANGFLDLPTSVASILRKAKIPNVNSYL